MACKPIPHRVSLAELPDLKSALQAFSATSFETSSPAALAWCRWDGQKQCLTKVIPWHASFSAVPQLVFLLGTLVFLLFPVGSGDGRGSRRRFPGATFFFGVRVVGLEPGALSGRVD